MKINLNIPQERQTFRFTKEGDWFSHLLDGTEPGFALAPVAVEFELTQAIGGRVLSGQLKTTAHLDCSRCLEETAVPIQADFRYVLAPPPQKDPSQEELAPEELDYIFCAEDSLDLEPIIFEQIVLQLPMKTLCRDDCRGLCHYCGANLNGNSCSCSSELLNTNFSVLKDFKIKKPRNH